MDLTEVAIHFRQPPRRMFENDVFGEEGENRLVFRLRPAESINLFVRAREPGLELRARELALYAPYSVDTSEEGNSYEYLLLDVLEGDKTSFLRFDEVEWSWRILQPILDAWSEGDPEPYVAGSDGPSSQHSILEAGHAWRPLALDGPEVVPSTPLFRRRAG
jgi:glucose-6-phosphate 1-dehydrogenase